MQTTDRPRLAQEQTMAGMGVAIPESRMLRLRRSLAMTSIRVFCRWKTPWAVLYTANILREYGRVNRPKLIRDAAVKRKVLQMLESATRGLSRLDAVTKPLDENTVKELLAKLQAPPLDRIADLKTLQHVVLGREELAGPDEHHAA